MCDLNPFLFAVTMDRIADEVRREPPWTMLFADDIVICEETREEVNRRLECWRYAWQGTHAMQSMRSQWAPHFYRPRANSRCKLLGTYNRYKLKSYIQGDRYPSVVLQS